MMHKNQTKITNENDVTKTAETRVTTSSFTNPTFEDKGVYPRIITITYPEGCGTSLVCSYQKDNEPPVEVKTKTMQVEFDYHGTLVATVTDGTNILSSTYNVKITLRAVDLEYNNSKTGLECEDAQCALDEIKKMLN